LGHGFLTPEVILLVICDIIKTYNTLFVPRAVSFSTLVDLQQLFLLKSLLHNFNPHKQTDAVRQIFSLINEYQSKLLNKMVSSAVRQPVKSWVFEYLWQFKANRLLNKLAT
jgi:hypothetical protein